MNCPGCGFNENRMSANYCKLCGRAFSEEERRKAYDQTIYGKLDRFSETKSWVTLSKITGSKVVKAAFLLVLAMLVLLNIRANGMRLAIRNSDSYELAYCAETDEYYILTEEESVELSVYLPQKAASCVLESYQNGELRETKELAGEDGLSVRRTEEGYFVLRATYENGKSEELLFFVCREVQS